MTLKNWYQHINWLNTTLIIFVPLIGLVSAYWVQLQWQNCRLRCGVLLLRRSPESSSFIRRLLLKL